MTTLGIVSAAIEEARREPADGLRVADIVEVRRR